MGDRVSISFKRGKDESVALFNHWGGMGFAEEAENYAQALMFERADGVMPLDRMEPNTVMVDFIRHITTGQQRIESSLYLGKDGSDGDNSDNGHHTIVLKETVYSTQAELPLTKGQPVKKGKENPTMRRDLLTCTCSHHNTAHDSRGRCAVCSCTEFEDSTIVYFSDEEKKAWAALKKEKGKHHAK